MSFLNGIKRNTVVEGQIVIVFEQFCVLFIYGIAIYADRDFLLLIVNLIVWHREPAFHLLCKHLLDSPAYRINHVEMHHRLAQTGVAEESLRAIGGKCIFQCAWNEGTSVGIIKKSWILNKVDALTQSIVLMGYAIVESLTDSIVIILVDDKN